MNPIGHGRCAFCSQTRHLTVRVQTAGGEKQALACNICSQDARLLRDMFSKVATPRQERHESK